MPAASSPPATMRRPRLPKIMFAPSLVSQAELLGFEDPVVAADDDRVAAGPRFARYLGRPLHGVPEPGVEGPEVLGRVRHRIAAEVVLDVGRLHEVIDEPSSVVVVDGDEARDVDV